MSSNTTLLRWASPSTRIWHKLNPPNLKRYFLSSPNRKQFETFANYSTSLSIIFFLFLKNTYLFAYFLELIVFLLRKIMFFEFDFGTTFIEKDRFK